jgi:hypothetical protein
VIGPDGEVFRSAKLQILGYGLGSHTVIGRASTTILGDASCRVCSDNLRDWSAGYTIVRAGGLLSLWTELGSVELIHAHAEVSTTALRATVRATNKAIYSS